MSCDKKVPRQALGGELGLAGNFPPHATVITNALQSPVSTPCNESHQSQIIINCLVPLHLWNRQFSDCRLRRKEWAPVAFKQPPTARFPDEPLFGFLALF